MVAEIRCANPQCGHPSRFGGDPLGRTFRCVRCGAKLPRTAGGLGGRATATSAPWETEERSPGRSLGAALPSRVGRYEVRDRVGAGATATVYRAFDPELEREVALKVAHSGSVLGGSVRERFLAESRILARLDHPRIVAVFDAGSDGATPYLATAFVDGQTLARCLEDGPLDPVLAAEIAADMAEALAHAHAIGIVHRDVKPANLLLDPLGQAHLTDFSIARSGSAEPSSLERLHGTPAYLAPELTDDGGPAIDLERCDQYSLGIVLFEMLCGRPPFVGPSLRVLYEARHEDPIPPHALRAGVPAALERICLKAMARTPEARYPSCSDLAADLRGWIKRARVRASALGTVRRAANWARRRPAAALSALISVVGVVATTVLASAVVTSTVFAPVPILDRPVASGPGPLPIVADAHTRP